MFAGSITACCPGDAAFTGNLRNIIDLWIKHNKNKNKMPKKPPSTTFQPLITMTGPISLIEMGTICSRYRLAWLSQRIKWMRDH